MSILKTHLFNIAFNNQPELWCWVKSSAPEYLWNWHQAHYKSDYNNNNNYYYCGNWKIFTVCLSWSTVFCCGNYTGLMWCVVQLSIHKITWWTKCSRHKLHSQSSPRQASSIHSFFGYEFVCCVNCCWIWKTWLMTSTITTLSINNNDSFFHSAVVLLLTFIDILL